MKKSLQVVCTHCHQPITEKSALESEKKRLADLAKAEAEDKAIEKACDEAEKKIRAAIKRSNFEHRLFKFELNEFGQGESIKNPIDYLCLDASIVGEPISEAITFDSYRDIVRFFQKLGCPLL